MKTVLLYGHLAQRFGRVHRYDVASPAEAVRALCATQPGFRRAAADGGAYRVLVGGRQALRGEQLHLPVGARESIRIVPVTAGAGRGLGTIIVGAALIYFSGGLASGVGGVFNASAATITKLGTAFSSFGASLVLSGVSQMLFPPRKPGEVERPENKPSYNFDGPVNRAAQGNPVPLLYGGPLIVGSQVISAGLSVEQI